MAIWRSQVSLRFCLHTGQPRSNYLLHGLLLAAHRHRLQQLGLVRRLDVLQIRRPLVLVRTLAVVLLRVDLVRQVQFEEVFLLLSVVDVLLNLVEGLLGAEVGLVVLAIDLAGLLLADGALGDLLLQLLEVLAVLLLPVLVLEQLQVVQAVDVRVELLLLAFALPLDALDLRVEAVQGLLVDGAVHLVGGGALVRGVVVNREGALRAEELGHRRVVVLRDDLAVQRGLDGLLRVGLRQGLRSHLLSGLAHRVDGEGALEAASNAAVDRAAEQLLVLLDVVLAHVQLGEA